MVSPTLGCWCCFYLVPFGNPVLNSSRTFAVTLSSMLQPGTQAPNFSLPDQDGNTVALSDYAGKWLVVYFYPKDDTPGCTKEACAFRDAYQDFTDAGADVIGISSDSGASHKKFADRHRLPFRLLADEETAVRKQYKVPNTLWVIHGRATFVINPQGTIVHAFNSQFNFTKHMSEALQAIKA